MSRSLATPDIMSRPGCQCLSNGWSRKRWRAPECGESWRPQPAGGHRSSRAAELRRADYQSGAPRRIYVGCQASVPAGRFRSRENHHQLPSAQVRQQRLAVPPVALLAAHPQQPVLLRVGHDDRRSSFLQQVGQPVSARGGLQHHPVPGLQLPD